MLAFLSTLSLRRATCYSLRHSAPCWHFYPRSPCGERLPLWVVVVRRFHHFYPRSPCGERLLTEINKMATGQISIHALLAESDLASIFVHLQINIFLSTLSLRRATPDKNDRGPGGQFLSTLSLRRATRPETKPARNLSNFYPRSPCGERRGVVKSNMSVQKFLSTLSLRRAT